MRVLVVDDNPRTAETLCEVLTAHGHEARIASGINSALNEINAKDPDVIILDLYLQGEDGEDLLKILDAPNPHRGTPVVALTAADDERVGTLTRLWPGLVILVKPADPNLLLEVLKGLSKECA